MDVDARILTEGKFFEKYDEENPGATLKQARDTYKKYKQAHGCKSLTSTASQDPSRLLDLNYVRKAFDCEYTNSSELRSSFFRYLEMFASTYDQDKYYSTYVTLIQASGSFASGGFPERSIYANNILHTKDVVSTRLQWTAYLCACLQELTDAQVEYEQYWAYHQSSEAQNSIKNRTNSIFRSLENCYNKIEKEEVQLRIKTELRKHYENFVVRCKERLDRIPSKLKLVFAFDEIQYLLLSAEKPIDRYYWLRIILRTLAEVQYTDSCIFAVVTDTMGELSNFAPQGKHDPSLRVQSGSHELYPLYYLLDTFNIHIRKAALEPRTLDKAAKCDYIFRFGRPLWYAQLSSAADPEYPVRLVRLAMAKLGFAQSKLRDFSMAVTILGSRLHLNISLQSELATDLVSNYMRLMTYMSEDR
ncbi:14163_t:CDS:2 [Funneliformis caledonium]|uniref:14163_t:CDS:1 n=1 Tax=Funneliformis caledonium TaxID=1117310 RepID=A0A9N8ZH95_9GLOM|nr:14163_t:CDS:2 [Funneliformis caledonium]